MSLFILKKTFFYNVCYLKHRCAANGVSERKVNFFQWLHQFICEHAGLSTLTNCIVFASFL